MDTPDWSFHSDAAALAQFVRDITSMGGRVLLFHNLGGRIDQFIKNYELDTSRVLHFGSKKMSFQLV